LRYIGFAMNDQPCQSSVFTASGPALIARRR
jgi:hypothetical protein